MSSSISTVRSFRLRHGTLKALRMAAEHDNTSPNKLAERVLREWVRAWLAERIAATAAQSVADARPAAEAPR